MGKGEIQKFFCVASGVAFRYFLSLCLREFISCPLDNLTTPVRARSYAVTDTLPVPAFEGGKWR